MGCRAAPLWDALPLLKVCLLGTYLTRVQAETLKL